MPSSSHLFGSMPWAPPVPVPGKPFHHTSYAGTMPMAGGMPAGVHSQFIPLQVRPERELLYFFNRISLSLLKDH